MDGSGWQQSKTLSNLNIKEKQAVILVFDLNTPNVKKYETNIFQYWLVSRCYYGNTVQVFRCDHSMVIPLQRVFLILEINTKI